VDSSSARRHMPSSGLNVKTSPLKGQVRSSLDSSHPTLLMGVVVVLGGIWEIVFWEIVFFRTDVARPVGPRGSAGRMPGSTAE
jgi:hypothetical protein